MNYFLYGFIKSMLNWFLFLSIAIFFNYNLIYPEETLPIRVIFSMGDVFALKGKENIKIQKDDRLSLDARVTVKANGKLEVLYNAQSTIILSAENSKLEDIVAYGALVNENSYAKLGGYRGLYEDTIKQLEEKSEISFQRYKGKVKDHNDWKKSIDLAFENLTSHSGKAPFPLQYAIIQDESFNAGAFPGGQFIINTGTLDHLDNKIEEKISQNSNLKKDKLRECYIAAILSHELIHYYNQHAMHSVKRELKIEENKLSVSVEDFTLNSIKFRQDDELESDLMGAFLLQKSGYSANYLIEILNILSSIQQEQLEKTKNISLPYFNSHPSPRTRLSLIDTEKKALHETLSKLEIIYADVILGKDLESAEKDLTEFTEKGMFKNSVELRKELAICKHKIWLKSAQLSELKLKTIIDSPNFKESLVKDQIPKGDSGIPGKEELFWKAMDSYEEIILENPESYFVSNYASLLVYSNRKSHRQLSVDLSERIAKTNANIQTINNLAVIYFLTEQKSSALIIMEDLAKALNPSIPKKEISGKKLEIQNKFSFSSYINLMQKFDPNYVPDEYVPILNLSLMHYDLKNLSESQTVARIYLNVHDSTSDWAKYLMKVTEVQAELEKIPELDFNLSGIKIGSSKNDLSQKWGAPNNLSSFGENTYFEYESRGARIKISEDRVIQIELEGENSIQLNSEIKIGISQSALFNIFKSKPKKNNGYFIYTLKNSEIAFQFKNEILKKIVLFK